MPVAIIFDTHGVTDYVCRSAFNTDSDNTDKPALVLQSFVAWLQEFNIFIDWYVIINYMSNAIFIHELVYTIYILLTKV